MRALAALLLGSIIATPATEVACVGEIAISERDVACSSEPCRLSREDRIATAILSLIVDAALRHASIIITDAEIAKASARSGGDEASIRKIGEMYRKLAAASLRVVDGEDAASVHAAELAQFGISRAMFDDFRKKAATRSVIEVFTRRDIESELRRDLQTNVRWTLSLDRLADFLQRQPDDEQRLFWLDVFSATRTIVHDKDFDPAHMKGALKKHEVTSTTTRQ
jgi:hypothetical protein